MVFSAMAGGRVLAQAVSGTHLAQWGLNLGQILPGGLLQGGGWVGMGESSVFTGICTCSQLLGGSG